MSNFFRKIPKSLVVLVFVLAVFTGHAFAVEGDISASTSAVDSAPADTSPDTPMDSSSDGSSDGSSDTSSDGSPNTPMDGSSDGSLDTSSDDTLSGDYGGSSNLPSGGYDTFTVSGADVTVNVQRHDTLSVASVSDGILDGLDSLSRSSDDTMTPTLAETIRSLFGTYTPRTQTVTTYYDGQPISTEEQIIPGLAGLDYEWLAGVGMFALVTFCLFRLLGGIMKNG